MAHTESSPSNASVLVHVQSPPPPSAYGELPLHLGCRKGNGQVVERLLDAGADPERFCGYGRNALQCAADTDSLDRDVLHWLTSGYTKRKKKEYIDLQDQNMDRRATHYVAGSPNQNIEAAIALEHAGADWTLVDGGENTPFEWAASHGHWVIPIYLARIQWGVADAEMKTEADFSVCRWTQVNVQIVSRESTYWKSGTSY